MTAPIGLADLGRRIMVMGPSSVGKSTLATAIGRKLDLPIVHVDLLRHLPDTDWVQRPDAEFDSLHAEAILEPEWVMDGNYGHLVPARLQRATGIVILDESLGRRYWRYLVRTLSAGKRHGGLVGGRDSIKWDMVRWLWVSRHHASVYRQRTDNWNGPRVLVDGERELNRLYGRWQLQRP